MQNVSAVPMSRKSIREFIKGFREVFELDNVLYFPIVHFIEWCLPGLGLNYEIQTLEEMRDTYGLTNTKRNVLYIREDVYCRAIEGNPRDRFTLCHELGHFLLHTPERISFARGDVPAYMNPEWQANTFAGELMAPYHLTCCMSVEEMMEMFLKQAKTLLETIKTYQKVRNRMEKYIGTKMIEVRVMNRGEYNKYRGWSLPRNENPEDEGYLVRYQDGYESWLPKKRFEEAYRDCQGMTFGIALELLKEGYKVAREGWNGKGMYLLLIYGEDIQSCTGIDDECVDVIYMKTAQNTVVFVCRACQPDRQICWRKTGWL